MQIHFISIGGSVMHQLAIALKRKGYQITGSDDEIFEPARTNLEREGILPPFIGWFPERGNVSLDAVILGMHAKEDTIPEHSISNGITTLRIKGFATALKIFGNHNLDHADISAVFYSFHTLEIK